MNKWSELILSFVCLPSTPFYTLIHIQIIIFLLIKSDLMFSFAHSRTLFTHSTCHFCYFCCYHFILLKSFYYFLCYTVCRVWVHYVCLGYRQSNRFHFKCIHNWLRFCLILSQPARFFLNCKFWHEKNRFIFMGFLCVHICVHVFTGSRSCVCAKNRISEMTD